MGSLSDKEHAAAMAALSKNKHLLEGAMEGQKAPVKEPQAEVVEKEVYKDSPAETQRKLEGKAARNQKKIEKERRSLITDLDVMLAKRPRYTYNPISKKYHRCGTLIGGRVYDWDKLEFELIWNDETATEELILPVFAGSPVTDEQVDRTYRELMATLESAKIDLERKNIKYEAVDLWIEEDIYGKPIVMNLYPKSRDSILPLPNRLCSAHWKSLLYNDGLRDIVYPIPPPVDENLHPPIVADHDWNSLVEYTRSQATDVPRLHAIKLISEQVPIGLDIIDAPGSFSSGNTSLSNIDSGHRKDREMLAHALKGMGLLAYDGQNGMCYSDDFETTEELVGCYQSETDTYSHSPDLLDRLDPRTLWRDLPTLLQQNPSLKDDLRDQIRHLAWVAFEAGREAERHRVTEEHASSLLEASVMEENRFESGEYKSDRTPVLIEAVHKYHEAYPEASVTEKKVRKYICSLEDKKYIKTYEAIGSDDNPKPRVNSLNHAIRTWRKDQ